MGTLNKLILQRVALSGPYSMRGGILRFETRWGVLMAGNIAHAIFSVMVSYAG